MRKIIWLPLILSAALVSISLLQNQLNPPTLPAQSPAPEASPSQSLKPLNEQTKADLESYRIFEGKIVRLSTEELVIDSDGKLITIKMKGSKTVSTPSLPDENQIKQIPKGTKVSVSAKLEEGALYVISLVTLTE